MTTWKIINFKLSLGSLLLAACQKKMHIICSRVFSWIYKKNASLACIKLDFYTNEIPILKDLLAEKLPYLDMVSNDL